MTEILYIEKTNSAMDLNFDGSLKTRLDCAFITTWKPNVERQRRGTISIRGNICLSRSLEYADETGITAAVHTKYRHFYDDISKMIKVIYMLSIGELIHMFFCTMEQNCAGAFNFLDTIGSSSVYSIKCMNESAVCVRINILIYLYVSEFGKVVVTSTPK
jgi:hypothetical protein